MSSRELTDNRSRHSFNLLTTLSLLAYNCFLMPSFPLVPAPHTASQRARISALSFVHTKLTVMHMAILQEEKQDW